MERPADPRKRQRLGASLVDVLPTELLYAVLDLVRPSEWRRYSSDGQCHALAATCLAFRGYCNSRVTELQITNTYAALTPELIAAKIAACSASLRLLTFTNIYPTTGYGYNMIVAAIRGCSRLLLVSGSFGPRNEKCGRLRPVDFGARVLFHPVANVHGVNGPRSSRSQLLSASPTSRPVIQDHDWSEMQLLARFELAEHACVRTWLQLVTDAPESASDAIKHVTLCVERHDALLSSSALPSRANVLHLHSDLGSISTAPLVLSACERMAGGRDFVHARMPSHCALYWAAVMLSTGLRSIEFPCNFNLGHAPFWLKSDVLEHVVVWCMMDAHSVVCRLWCRQEITLWVPLADRDEARALLRPGLRLGYLAPRLDMQ